jgi:hypothetical protein
MYIVYDFNQEIIYFGNEKLFFEAHENAFNLNERPKLRKKIFKELLIIYFERFE